MTRRQLAALESRIEQARSRQLALVRIVYADDAVPQDDGMGLTIVRAVNRPRVDIATANGTVHRPDSSRR